MKTLLALALAVFALCSCSCTAITEQQLKNLSNSAGPARNQSLLELLLGPQHVAACPGDRRLHLEGVIDDQLAQALVADLRACGDKPVLVEINSPGGSVMAALAIQKAVESQGQVTCVVDGMAASAAAVTLQSCQTRLATDRSIIMFHTAAIQCEGHEQQMLNCAAILKALDEGMTAHAAARMGMSVADFAARIAGDREWWLSGPAAVEAHAVDALTPSVGAAAEAL